MNCLPAPPPTLLELTVLCPPWPAFWKPCLCRGDRHITQACLPGLKSGNPAKREHECQESPHLRSDTAPRAQVQDHPELWITSWFMHCRHWVPALCQVGTQWIKSVGSASHQELSSDSYSVAPSCLTSQPSGLQHARLPCPLLSPRVCSNSGPLRKWCDAAISSSATLFFTCPPSFPASGSFPVCWLVTSGGQSIGVSASASVLPMNIQGWFPLGLIGLISLQSKGLSRVFSSTTVQKHQLFSAEPFVRSNSHVCTCLLEKL